MFIKKTIQGATTATSIAKGLTEEEKLGLFSIPPRQTRTSMGKLQVRDCYQREKLFLADKTIPRRNELPWETRN